jgi:hypothetical protein
MRRPVLQNIKISNPATPPAISISHSAARSDNSLPSFTTLPIIVAPQPESPESIANEAQRCCSWQVTRPQNRLVRNTGYFRGRRRRIRERRCGVGGRDLSVWLSTRESGPDASAKPRTRRGNGQLGRPQPEGAGRPLRASAPGQTPRPAGKPIGKTSVGLRANCIQNQACNISL